ncbi:FG-GAP repeat domain-containing protein [Micromonospora sp. KLBMP9576]|uniref:FG-GAP repeat domain-containing protein n=1 Tax=Micromonospora sp. KLBMP9576 TaxID=3424769 RepID=UPI003D8F8830
MLMLMKSVRSIVGRAVVASLGAVVAATVAIAPTGALAAPPTPSFSSAIDEYASYDGQSTCDPTPKSGVAGFKDLLNATYGSHTWGIGRDCGVGDRSEHKEGRALDYHFNYYDSAQRADADDLLNWLLATDRHGNKHAMARRLGMMYIIWNNRIWNAYEASSGWQPYSGASPHTDHIHFSFSWAGAEKLTSWWAGGSSAAKASPILGYDDGTTTVMYRWGSNGISFSGLSTATHYSNDLDNVGARVASGDVNGDGRDDTVMAHQNADGTFSFKVLLNGTAAPVTWFTSGPFNLGPVGDRLVVGDFNGDGKAEPILAYDSGTTTILYRWYSTGAAFGSLSTATHYSTDLDNVGGRMAAGDVTGDGKDDTVMAYQNTDGTFAYKVFPSGTMAPVTWFTSGPFNLGPVGDRLVVGDFNGDGKAEPILAYDSGTTTILYRWYSTGAAFGSLSTATHYSTDLDNVGGRMAAGDVHGDGKDDTVMAYQNTDGTFSYKVFQSGTIAPVDFYRSGGFNLGPVGDRLLLGSWL